MLVESVDGEHALLGRPRSLKRRGPVLTCLSGFIEQGESIEEAVSLAAVFMPSAQLAHWLAILGYCTGSVPRCPT